MRKFTDLPHSGVLLAEDFHLSSMKKESIYFDFLIMETRHIDLLFGFDKFPVTKELAAGLKIDRESFDLLFRNGVIESAENCLGNEFDSFKKANLEQAQSEFGSLWKTPLRIAPGAKLDSLLPSLQKVANFTFGYRRRLSNRLSDLGFRASPIYPKLTLFDRDFGSSGVTCLSAVLNSLPMLDESVAWQDIIDFRDSPDTQRKLRAIRNWQNDVTRENLKPHEIADKLAHLLDEYTEHMKLHKMKYELGAAEMILTIGAEILEGLLRLKPTKVVKAMLSFGKRELDLKEAELKTPGREVAFVYKAREHFGR